MDATKEPIPDLPTEERPASTSRILASILIGTVLVLQILITGALLALLIRLNASDKNSPSWRRLTWGSSGPSFSGAFCSTRRPP